MNNFRRVFIFIIVSTLIYEVLKLLNILSPILVAASKTITCFMAIAQVLRINNENKIIDTKYKVVSSNDYCIPIGIGLLFCAIGDFILQLDHSKTINQHHKTTNTYLSLFAYAIISFIIAHISFIIAFYRDGGNGHKIFFGIPFYILASFMIQLSVEKFTENEFILEIIITIYAITIATMGHRALSVSIDGYPGIPSARYAMYGGILFIISSSVFALGKYVYQLPYVIEYIIVRSTYVLALCFITLSCDGSKRWSA
jgi:uncharacterized membrane protein YhhN